MDTMCEGSLRDMMPGDYKSSLDEIILRHLGKKGCIELFSMDMPGCESWFSREHLEKSLDSIAMRRCDELQITLFLEEAGLKGLCKCLHCDFQASLPESAMIFQCPSSEFESCRKRGEESLKNHTFH